MDALASATASAPTVRTVGRGALVALAAALHQATTG